MNVNYIWSAGFIRGEGWGFGYDADLQDFGGGNGDGIDGIGYDVYLGDGLSTSHPEHSEVSHED